VGIEPLAEAVAVSKDSLKDEAWHIRAAWRITAWRERAEQLRIETRTGIGGFWD
jgi:hypothetical protein